MINIGVVGFGYWGPNIVRNLSSIANMRVHAICDQDPQALARAKKLYPKIQLYQDYQLVTDSPVINAVAVVTPVSSHFKIAKRALAQGKHVFVEKPFTSSSAQGHELIRIAERKKLTIMVGYTYLFTSAVQKIKQVISSRKMGDIYYFDSTRVSLGRFQNDVNVVWDLAVHDLSIIDYLIKSKPKAVSAQGIDYLGQGYENLAYITVYFEDPIIAHINVNWLSPVKLRNILIGGNKKMLLWDDLEPDEKIKIYDRGIKASNKEGEYKMLVEYRSGNIFVPKLSQTEALRNELMYFRTCIIKKQTPFNDGYAGLRIIQLLEAADSSIRNKGRITPINGNGHKILKRFNKF